MKARRAAKKEKSEEETQKELEEKLLQEQAEDSEIDKRNALDMEQGGLALLQEAILSEVERKHASEQEVRFARSYLKCKSIFLGGGGWGLRFREKLQKLNWSCFLYLKNSFFFLRLEY